MSMWIIIAVAALAVCVVIKCITAHKLKKQDGMGEILNVPEEHSHNDNIIGL